MKQFEYLEHTAEAKFAAYGKTMEEAFSNAAKAMENIIVDTEKIKPKVKKKITIETKHKKALLYDFLQELLVLFDSERFALHDVEQLKIEQKGSDYHLHATVSGDDAQYYEIHSGVKSVTYNEMEITRIRRQRTSQPQQDAGNHQRAMQRVRGIVKLEHGKQGKNRSNFTIKEEKGMWKVVVVLDV